MKAAASVKVEEKNLLDEGYRPGDDEPFMNERQIEYFRRKLQNWKEDILRESRAESSTPESDLFDGLSADGAGRYGWQPESRLVPRRAVAQSSSRRSQAGWLTAMNRSMSPSTQPLFSSFGGVGWASG